MKEKRAPPGSPAPSWVFVPALCARSLLLFCFPENTPSQREPTPWGSWCFRGELGASVERCRSRETLVSLCVGLWLILNSFTLSLFPLELLPRQVLLIMFLSNWLAELHCSPFQWSLTSVVYLGLGLLLKGYCRSHWWSCLLTIHFLSSFENFTCFWCLSVKHGLNYGS